MSRGRAALAVALLAGLVLVGYAGVIRAYFLADDFLLIHTVLDGRARPDWSVAVQHLYSTQYVETFRPMVTFIHTVAYAAWGASPTGYHLLNLGIHLANAVLLLALVRQLCPRSPALLPLAAAMLFAVHPAHPEAVTYIGALPGLACALFYLLGLVSAARYCARPRWRWLALGLASFLLALASKEEAISFPFAVGLIAFARPRRPALRGRIHALIYTSLPYFLLLLLYLAHRRLIFGHVAPSYYRDVHGTPVEILRGTGTFVLRLISPINLAYVGPHGWLVYASVLTILAGALTVFVLIRRPPVSGLAFCAAGFLVALIPVNKILIFGVYPDLSNSRFLYFPSLAFAAAVALILCGRTRDDRPRWPMLAGVVGCLTISLAQLIVNNMAWADASGLMRTMQRESRRLTGNMAHIEIVNMPDTVHGVLFDRGGFRRSLLTPFVPDNALHRRERTVILPVPGDDGAAVETLFPEPEALGARIDPNEGRSSGTGARMRVVFQPRSAKTYRGEVLVKRPGCPRAIGKISVRGRGSSVSPLPTSLSASVAAAEHAGPSGAPAYVATITDFKDGIAAEEVQIQLLAGASWRLRYLTLNAAGHWDFPDTPVHIPDGGSKAFRLELTPVGPAPDRRIVPRMFGLNAPVVPAMPGKTVIDLPDEAGLPGGGRAADHVRGQPLRGASSARECAELAGIPTELDFGVVPIAPHPLRQDRRFAYYGGAPGLLFWDDLRRRLMPMDEVENAVVYLRVSGGDLASWQRTPALSYLAISPSVAALHVGAPGQFIDTGDVDIPTVEAAYFMLHMRVVDATSPYAVLSWKGARDEPDSPARAAALVMEPDGYWHTYAIALHSLPGWRSTPRVRYLRLHPVLSPGWVEIDSVGVIGPIP